MSLEVPDVLTCEVRIEAPRDRVWAAITQAELLLRWFPTHQAEVDLREGGEMRFGWEDSNDEAVIEEIEVPSRFVFRWRPAGLDRPFTTVTFSLEPDGDGTLLTLTEFGFSRLPDELYEQSYEGNLKGWGQELEELRAFLEAA